MKCPHCLENFPYNHVQVLICEDAEFYWQIEHTTCPACRRAVIFLMGRKGGHVLARRLVNPKGIARSPLSVDVPQQFVKEYKESCLVLADSPKASAALSRRCLQSILREVAKIKPSDLAKEIQEVLDHRNLPSHIAEALDAVRNIGNFAAHPIKSQRTGEVLPVEPGEAEWNLDVLESLFDYYFVQPALLKKKKDALNAKLAEAGKPQIK